MTPEGYVVKSCLDYLAVRGIYAWRSNTGVARPERRDGSRGFVRFGHVGSADILGVMPGGRFLGIECKAPRGNLSRHQLEFGQRVRADGGIYMVVRSVDDLIEQLQELENLAAPEGRV